MPLTVSAVVDKVVGRFGGLLAAVGLSAVRDDTNADLVEAVRAACVRVGVTTAEPGTVTDTDLAAVAGPRADKLIDAARLEALYTAQVAAAALVDVVVGDNEQKLSQIRTGLDAAVKFLEARLAQPYGPSAVPAPAVGSMTTGDPMPNDPLNPWRSRVNPCLWPYPGGN